MMGHKNLNRSVAVLAALLMAACAFAVIANDSSDADPNFSSGDISASGFKQDKSGTLTVTIHSDAADAGKKVTIQAFESGVEKDSESIVLDSETTHTVTLKFKLSQGTHQLVVKGDYDGTSMTSQSITIESGDNIWSHVSSYVIIVIIVIVIIVIAVAYIRARPNNKPSTTFTQLEEERKAAASEKQAAAPGKTEKVKYTSSRRK